MIPFLRGVRPLLDGRARRRLGAAAALACVLAAVDAVAIALVVPLVRALYALESDVIPGALDGWADLLGVDDAAGVALGLGVLVFAGFVLKGILGVAYVRWNLRFIMRLEADAARRLLDGYLHAPYTFHLQRNSAELQRTIHLALRQIYREGMVGFVGGAADAVVITAIAAVVLIAEPVAAVSAAGYFAVVGFGYQRLIHRRIQEAASTVHDDAAHAYKVVQQSVGSAKELLIAGRQRHFVDELHRTERELADRQATLLFLGQLPRYYLEIALVVGVAVMSLAVFSSTSDRAEATATLGMFLIAGFRVLPSLNRVLVAVANMRAGLPAVEQVTGDLAAVARPGSEAARGPVEPIDPATIHVRGVSYRYPESDAMVLNEVDIQISRGESVALVGPSGAGKTTLVDVVLGLLEPVSGVVRLDEHRLDEVRDRWQRSIGYVPQQISLLDDTVRANVAFGRSEDEIEDDRLHRALRDAQLDAFLDTLPAGSDTVLGEGGSRLSGGQRQRIGIARAIYGDPSMLVLDEATSALDAETEALVTSTIDALRGRMTVIVIAHRLTTIRACDRIHYMESGRVVSSGTFDQLRADEPGFARLVRLSELEPETRA